MSLRTLLTIMALVSTAMAAALIYKKVLRHDARSNPSLAELRALERVCEAQCERDAPRIVAAAKSTEEVAQMANACLDTCVKRVLTAAAAAETSAAR